MSHEEQVVQLLSEIRDGVELVATLSLAGCLILITLVFVCSVGSFRANR